ncbi:MAG: hypothetical protein PHC51_05690 [bacterium]|nr:hypothetical protein [bacterium]
MRKLLFILTVCLSLTILNRAQAQAPAPQVTLSTASQALFSDPVTVSLSMENSSVNPAATGFYPIIEVILPDGVECDAGCQSAIASTNPVGAPLTLEVHGGYGIPGASYLNSITGESITLLANETLIIITPPLGTLSVGQPAVSLEIPATFSAAAVLGTAETVRSRGIFVLGDAANGARGACGGANDTLCQTQVTSNITPVVLLVDTTHSASPAEATGPNFPRTINITGDVATGKTVTAVTFTETIPDTIIVNDPPAADCTGSGSFTFAPVPTSCSYSADANGGGSFTATYASIAGGAGNDVTISYTGYVQQYLNNDGSTSIIDPLTGNATSSSNAVTADYTYLAVPRAQIVDSVTIPQKSLVVNKSALVSTDAAPVGNSPGDTVTWTVTSYVSDYFAFDDLLFSDDIGDGQTYVGDSFRFYMYENTSLGFVNNLRTNDGLFGGELVVGAKDGVGVTHIALNVSGALVNLLAADDTLTGGPTGPGNATTTEISYQTTIDENYVAGGAGGNTLVVDGADDIPNTSTTDFRLLSTVNRQTLVSNAAVTIATIPSLSKELVFKNGGAPGVPPILLGLGDTVTYKLTIPIPTGDAEDFSITDYLPTPILDATDPDANGVTNPFIKIAQGDVAPSAGEWRYTSTSYVPGSETFSVNSDDNTVKWNFADVVENGAASALRTMEILITLAATNEPYGNGLQLVNIAFAQQGDSLVESVVNIKNDLVEITAESPELVVTKNALTILSGNGAIASGNVTGADAAERIRFEVSLENIGAKEAFDVELSDNLPVGLSADAAFNIVVADGGGGAGCNIGSFNTAGTAGNNLNIVDGRIPVGAICLITYDVAIDDTALLGRVYTNTVNVLYASEVAGPKFSPLSDTATVTVRSPVIGKAYQNGSSSDALTSDPNLRPGESGDFLFTVTVPEGQANSFVINERDTGDLFAGLTPANISFTAAIETNCSNVAPPYNTYYNFVGLTDVCFSLDPTNVLNQTQSDSTNYRISFGTLVNFNTNDGATETFTLTVTPTARDITTGAKTNYALVEWNNGSATSVQGTSAFNIVKPALTLTKTTTAVAPVSIGDVLPYLLTVTNSGSSKAFDVADVVDTLPTGVGGATLTSAEAQAVDVTGQGNFSFSAVGQTVTVAVVDTANQPDIVESQNYAVAFDATVQGTMVNDTTNGPGHPGGVVDGPGCVNSITNSFDVAQFDTGDAGSGVTISSVTAATRVLTLDSDGDGILNSVETVGMTCPDSDGDGVANHLDTDSDDNGISDTIEYAAGNDHDGDGIDDYRDTDDDNDGISDWLELVDEGNDALGDQDGDGVPNWQDLDSDNDGILDSEEGNSDSDGDGVPDYLDLDSDKDGISDIVEAGGVDVDGDGRGDLPVDSDGDGLLDIFDSDSFGVALSPFDSDGDGNDDYLDIDADNDGLVDNIESQSEGGYVAPSGNDTDGDGLDDAYDIDNGGAALVPVNTDGADAVDYLDADSDNDGISDIVEGSDANGDGIADYVLSGVDTDGDGLDNVFDNYNLLSPPGTGSNITGSRSSLPDLDRDNRRNFRDIDDDGDGMLTSFESSVSSDSDIHPDYLDIDSDNDGLVDNIEAQTTPGYRAPSGLDTDNDGLDNEYDTDNGGTALAPVNTDGAGAVDYLDLDSDEDGIVDSIEAWDANGDGIADSVRAGIDSDGDGLDDNYDTWNRLVPPGSGYNSTGANAPEPDSDNDGEKNWRDIDDDGDNIPTVAETDIDTDDDGIPNYVDTDSDGDGVTDLEEGTTDTDGDGIVDYLDALNCTLTGSLKTTENDGIAGANITLLPGNLTGISADDGGFSIPGVFAGSYSLEARAEDGQLISVLEDFAVAAGNCGLSKVMTVDYQLRSPVFFVWNSFLRQSNILVVGNKGENQLHASVVVYNLEGVVLKSFNLTLKPHSERDLFVNSFDGYSLDTYGFVKIVFDNEKDFDGHSAYYRMSKNGERVEFAILKPFESMQRGTTYGLFNTIEPTSRPEKQDDESPQWLQIVNLHESLWKKFTIKIYGQTGGLLQSSDVIIPPRGRRDRQAGHQVPGIGHVGLVEVVPADQQSPYLAQLFSYNSDGEIAVLAPTWSFAGGATTGAGVSDTQYVPVSSGSGALNWINVANTAAVAGGALVEIHNSLGQVVFAESWNLPARSQRHLLASSFLADGETGIARITPAAVPLLVRTMGYFYNSHGFVTASFPEPARLAQVGPLGSFWNTFWEQENWLRLYNISDQNTQATAKVYGIDGALLGVTTITLAPMTSRDMEIRTILGISTANNSYGVVTVESSVNGAITGDVLRVKREADGSMQPDMVKALPLR